MAKFQIVKETSFTGTILYSIEKDGQYIFNSATHSLDRAEEYLKNILNNNEKETIKETIKTIEIDENETN